MIRSIDSLRRRFRDSLPPSLGMCFTLRANPFLGLLFLLLRRRFHLDGMIFQVPLRHQTLSSLATYWFNDYELPERKFCSKFLRATDRVCELGGCLGIVSMIINSKLNTPTEHLVIEANPTLIPYLHSNRNYNGGQFKILNRAIGDGESLYLDIEDGVLTSTLRECSGHTTVTVQGCTTDSLFKDYGPFDALVMDIEGAETQVLLGSCQSWKSVRVIIAEMHPSIIGEHAYLEAQSKLIEANFKFMASHIGEPHVVEVWEKASDDGNG